MTAVVGALALAGCSNGAAGAPATPSGTATVNAKLAALVPDEVKQAGTLQVATDPTYAPFESKPDGKTVVGLDADMAHAIGDLLGLKVSFVETSFDGIIPALAAKKVDMAMSSIGDTKEREKTVDFATYYWNGTLVMVSKGNPKGLRTDQTCGARIGVIRGSLQQTTFLPQQESVCASAGKPAPTADVYQNGPQAILALQSDRIDGVMLDAPPLAEAVQKNPDKFETVGPLVKNPNPGGIALPKDSKLTAAVNAAVNELIQNGTYSSFLSKWKLDDIKIDKSVINGAKS